MAGKHFVGADYADFTNSGLSAPVSRVTMMIDAETALTAGDDSGYEMKSECPFATQEMVDALLARVRGYRFQMFSAEAARLDPTAELGDAVDIGGVHAIISHRSDDGSMFPDISAVGEAELEDEYPTEGPLTREFNQKIAQTRSYITKTAEQIRLEITKEVEGLSTSIDVQLGLIDEQVNGLDGRLGEVEITAESITQQVTGLDGAYAQIRTEVETVTSKVSGLNGQFSLLEQTIEGLTVSGPDGSTRIKGSVIETDSLNLTGVITFSDLESSVRDAVNNRGISSNDATQIAHTTIKSDLMEGPTIKGAEIFGGKFANLDKTYWLELGNTGYDHVMRLYKAAQSSVPVFSVGETNGFVYLNAFGYPFMTTENTGGYTVTRPMNEWDFSGATVVGLDSKTADYVTEQGASGGWTYRMWNSGIAECWRTETVYNVAVTNQWGNVYTSNEATFGGVSYPFRFTSAPSVQVSPENANGDWWVVTKVGGNASTSPGYQVCRGTQISSMSSCRAHFYVVGRWK